MNDSTYGDYSRIARIPELRFLGVSTEILSLPRPVDFRLQRPRMACFYHILRGHLRFYPDAAIDQYHELGPGYSVGIEDGRDQRWVSFEPAKALNDNRDNSENVELYAGQVDRRHTVIQRLLNAVVIVPADSGPQSAVIGQCVNAMIIEQERPYPNEKVMRRFSEIIQLEMLDFADQKLADTGPIPPEIKRNAPLLRAWTAFLNDPAHCWTVKELAGIAGISRTSFFEQFNRAIANSPVRAMREIRLRYAAEMLRTSQAPVSEIAAKVGYGSDIALLRAFRQEMGMTPAKWRAGQAKG